jgi:mannose/cellobiose epimerase-like protein (N-acyl-D-glucosamine 2-epimerase family)
MQGSAPIRAARTGTLSSGDDSAVIRRLCNWTFDELLPFFAAKGISESGAFVEEFDLTGRPLPDEGVHARVQARQIYVFAHAALLLGEQSYAEIAHAGFERMACTLWDKQNGGWIHAAAASGDVLEPRCDAYDQAFPLLALAFLRRLGVTEADSWIGRSLEALDRRLADYRHGGYFEEDSGGRAAHLLRRQNPHMHLLEAFLALEQAGWPGDARERATRIVALFAALADRDGAIGEYFGQDWSPPPRDKDVREPGHQFEWAWLLDVFGKGRGESAALAARLGSFGWQHGVERNPAHPHALFEAIAPDGGIVVESKLLWPQTEAIRYYARRARLGDNEARARANRLAETLLGSFATADGPLWYNQLDRSGKPLVRSVPSRVLYHIVTCAADAEKLA